MSEHDSALQTTMARLSSGLRVTSARDDAAGLAIASRMLAQERGDRQALRNTNDAISLAQTAEGALGVMTQRLQRMRELLVQSADGAIGSGDRISLDDELQQQRVEFDRIAAATALNGRTLLDGSIGTARFQVGAAAGDVLDIALGTSSRSADVGALAVALSADLRTVGNRIGGFVFEGTYTTIPITQLDFSQPEVRFRGGSAHTVGSVATNYSGGGAAQFTVDGIAVTLNADYLSLAGATSAVRAQLGSGYTVAADATGIAITSNSAVAAPQIIATGGANAAPFGDAVGSAGVAASHTTNAGISVDGHRVSLTSVFDDFDSFIASIESQLDATAPGQYRVGGSSAGLSITRIGALDPPSVAGVSGIGASAFAAAPQTGLTLASGDFVVQVGQGPAVSVIGNFLTPQQLADAVSRQVGDVAASIDAATGRLEIDAKQTLTLSGSTADPSGALAFDQLVVAPSGSLDDSAATTTGVVGRSILRVDASLDEIADQRARFGALQSRLGVVASGLQCKAELTATGRGRIVDVDYASETAALVREQVLRRAAQAVLAQANLRARDVLELLR